MLNARVESNQQQKPTGNLGDWITTFAQGETTSNGQHKRYQKVDDNY
jgi:hypothetical protein